MNIHELLSKEIEICGRERPVTSKVVEGLLEKWRPEANLASPHLHTLTRTQLKAMHGQQVLISMMVQDCLEPELYHGALVPKQATISTAGGIAINKYWPTSQIIEDIDKYESLLLQRDVYHVTPIKGESKWVRSYQNSSGEVVSAILRVYDGPTMKLGQVVYAACLVDFQDRKEHYEEMDAEDPQTRYPQGEVPRLNVIKILSEEEVTQSRLNIEDELLSREVSFEQSRQAILNVFRQFSTEAYSHALLCSLIAQGPANMYLSGENLYPLIEQLLPYTLLVSLKIPLKQKLFPYKEHFIQQTLMQVSERPTYVVVDFTDLGAGKIGEEEIITLKLLKVFVEDGQLNYRWEYGESFVKIDCSGIVARGSSIIKPNITAKNQKITLEAIPKLSEDELWRFRTYLAHCRKTLNNVEISTETAEKIKDDFLQERQEKGEAISGDLLNLRLLLTRLDCASRGSTSVLYEGYTQAKQLLNELI